MAVHYTVDCYHADGSFAGSFTAVRSSIAKQLKDYGRSLHCTVDFAVIYTLVHRQIVGVARRGGVGFSVTVAR